MCWLDEINIHTRFYECAKFSADQASAFKWFVSKCVFSSYAFWEFEGFFVTAKILMQQKSYIFKVFILFDLGKILHGKRQRG